MPTLREAEEATYAVPILYWDSSPATPPPKQAAKKPHGMMQFHVFFTLPLFLICAGLSIAIAVCIVWPSVPDVSSSSLRPPSSTPAPPRLRREDLHNASRWDALVELRSGDCLSAYGGLLHLDTCHKVRPATRAMFTIFEGRLLDQESFKCFSVDWRQDGVVSAGEPLGSGGCSGPAPPAFRCSWRLSLAGGIECTLVGKATGRCIVGSTGSKDAPLKLRPCERKGIPSQAFAWRSELATTTLPLRAGATDFTLF